MEINPVTQSHFEARAQEPKKEGPTSFGDVHGGSPLKFGHEPGRWVACDYAIFPAILNEILDKLEVVPESDAFANKETNIFEKWYGKAVLMGRTPSKKMGESGPIDKASLKYVSPGFGQNRPG